MLDENWAGWTNWGMVNVEECGWEGVSTCCPGIDQTHFLVLFLFCSAFLLKNFLLFIDVCIDLFCLFPLKSTAVPVISKNLSEDVHQISWPSLGNRKKTHHITPSFQVAQAFLGHLGMQLLFPLEQGPCKAFEIFWGGWHCWLFPGYVARLCVAIQELIARLFFPISAPSWYLKSGADCSLPAGLFLCCC